MSSGHASDSNRNPKGVSVLFVCLGNICRSTMAEGAFRRQTHYGTAQQHPLVSRIDSCGTGAYHTGDQPDFRTLDVLRANGITDYKHGARQIRVPADFREFDYIVAMDTDNEMDLRDMAKRASKKGLLTGDEAQKVRLYGSFQAEGGEEEIGDPYYGGRNGFSKAWEQVNRFGQALLSHIDEQAANGGSD